MSESNSTTSSGGGCGCLGMIVAAVLSWIKWHSILWLFINGIFSWFYVIYFALCITRMRFRL